MQRHSLPAHHQRQSQVARSPANGSQEYQFVWHRLTVSIEAAEGVTTGVSAAERRAFPLWGLMRVDKTGPGPFPACPSAPLRTSSQLNGERRRKISELQEEFTAKLLLLQCYVCVIKKGEMSAWVR